MANLIDRIPSTQAQFYARTDGTTPLIEVAGEIDLANVDAFERCLAVFEPGEAVIVDLSRLTYIDSRGIAALVQAHNRGVDVTCRGAQDLVRRVFDVCGLDTLLTFED